MRGTAMGEGRQARGGTEGDRADDLDMPPWATIALALAILAGFVAVGTSVCSLTRAGALVRPLVLEGHEWYRLLVPALLHGSESHWFWNTVALLLAGWTLEPLNGPAWLFATFVLAVVGGTLCSLAFGGDYALSVGASGGILGLFAAKLVLAYARFPPGELRNRLVASSVRVVITSLLPAAGSGGEAIDVAAHWGGALAGTALAFALTAIWQDDDTQPGWRRIAWAVAAIAAVVVAWDIAAAAAQPACR